MNNKIYDFLPGISGYGQAAPKGETGNKGTSVYYTPYRLSFESDYDLCIDRINNNYELSDNYVKKMEYPYSVGDVIIDSSNTPYFLIKNPNDEFELTTTGVSKKYDLSVIDDTDNDQPTENASFLTISCVTSNLKGNNKSYILANPKKRSYLENVSSPYVYYRSYYNDYAGNWIKFSLNNFVISNDNIFKFVLVLPNGKTLSKISFTYECVMFVANSEFYSCDADDTIIADLFNNITSEYSFDKEYSENTSLLIYNYFIKNRCNAYVDVISQTSGNILRYFLNVEDNIRYSPENITYEIKEYDTQTIFRSYKVFADGVKNADSITDKAHNFYYINEANMLEKDCVLRINVQNISNVRLYGKVNKYNPNNPFARTESEGITDTPKCCIYIGYPNMPIVTTNETTGEILFNYNTKYTSYVDDETISNNIPDSNISYIDLSVGNDYADLSEYFIDIALGIEINDDTYYDNDHRPTNGLSFDEDSNAACGQSDFVVFPVFASNNSMDSNVKLISEVYNG